jgi:hypothetical protein
MRNARLFSLALLGFAVGCQSGESEMMNAGVLSGAAFAPAKDDEQPVARPGIVQVASRDQVSVAGKKSAGTSLQERFEVLWGPYPPAGLQMPGDDTPSGEETPFEVQAGFAFTFRPMSWPLGRTRRIAGGSAGEFVELLDALADTRLFAIFQCGPDLERIILVNCDQTANACREHEFWFKAANATPPRVTAKIGQYVELRDNELRVKDLGKDGDVMELIRHAKSLATERGLRWMEPYIISP